MNDQISKKNLVLRTLAIATSGLIGLAFVSKRNELSTLLKDLDKQLYDDGRLQADKIHQVKQDVTKQVK